MSGHFSYLRTYRPQSPKVVMQSSRYQLNMDRETWGRSSDERISVKIRESQHERRKRHIYRDENEYGNGAYDNSYLRVQSVLDRASTGGSRYRAAAGIARSSSSGQWRVYSTWELDEDDVMYRPYIYTSRQSEWTPAGSRATSWRKYEAEAGSRASAWGTGYRKAVASREAFTSSQPDWDWIAERKRYYSRSTSNSSSSSSSSSLY
ncbi:hypothetical protein ACQKWADRAFT_305837 [Trichoderma austrokoningii]